MERPRGSISPHDTEEERWTLRDGSVVVIRPLQRDDHSLVQAIFDWMGEEMRYRRFLGHKKRLSAKDLETLTSVDHHSHEALVALDAESGRALGVARMMQEPERPDTAEASVAVADAWQGRGLGGTLLDRLVRRAREEGVRRFTVALVTRDRATQRLFERRGAVRVGSRYGDTLELVVELSLDTDAPREALRAAAVDQARTER